MKQEVFTVYSDPIAFGEIQEKGEKKFIAEGFISTSERDLVDDVVTDRALDSMMNQMKSRVIKLDFEHEAFRGETDLEMEINKTRMTLAKAVDFARIKDGERNGVKVRWEFNDTWKKFDSKGDVVMNFLDIKKNVEKGFYDAFSIAFVPTKSVKKNMKDGSLVRLLDGMNLLNVALTGNPINPGASMTNVFLKSLKSLNDSGDKIKLKRRMKDMPEEETNDESQSNAESETQEETEEQSEEGSAEKKANELNGVEVKSRLDALEKSVANIEKALNKPVQKAISEQKPKDANVEEKAVEPLDLI